MITWSHNAAVVASWANQACCISFCVSFWNCNTKETSSSSFLIRVGRVGKNSQRLPSSAPSLHQVADTWAQSPDSGKQPDVMFTWTPIWSQHHLLLMGPIWLEQCLHDVILIRSAFNPITYGAHRRTLRMPISRISSRLTLDGKTKVDEKRCVLATLVECIFFFFFF